MAAKNEITQEWEIKGRSAFCTATNRPFADGETVYTLLFQERKALRRDDLCEEAWQQRDPAAAPFSFWRFKFELNPPPPEPLAKNTAESLLRRYMGEEHAEHANLRYILALMLERKRILKPVEQEGPSADGQLIYLHAKTGEVFIIPDPKLRLDQVEAVQAEVVGLLADV